ncbi:hypothetical protein EZV62_016157 [Acer yangbiense]|uniref:Uncharacterized protein n=1 Tax=Acer yangbiense TaxID=1000413 RepID=A0A5C7HNH5_9ROSI|nr:hypothetical protein EZV62_016157 [Acer yangbiense]
MMAHQKHLLHELLQEDQEPFQLKNYIADRRCQLKRSSPNTQLQVKKRKPLSQTSNFTSNFCKNACLFSFQDSPDPRKSPLFEFQSPAKSPCRSPNAIFLHIPARTAALLLEAAHRIQKQSSKPKIQNKNSSFSLFGSLRKKLTHRNKTRKLESSSGDGVKVSVKDILRWDSSVGRSKASNEMFKEQMVGVEEKSACEMGFSCSCDGRPSSAVWSESNEDKSLDLDLETSCSSQCEDYFGEEIEFVSNDRENGDFDSCEKHFCESPFRFVLQKSPSSGLRTPDFSSPATSPNRYKKEDKESHDIEIYAIVQRAKQQLLHKLRRFEKLAELDPIELEKRMLEQEEDDDDDTDNDTNDLEEEEDSEDYESNVDGFLKQVVSQSDYHHQRRIPEDMKRLMTDLIAEEEREQNRSDDREGVVKRVCRRLESWKEVEPNTIDMMVEQDIRKQLDGWKRNDQEQVGDTALEIELAIFGLLMEELSEELVV